VDELQLQADARLGRQNAAQPFAIVTRDDHGLTNSGLLERPEHPDAEGDSQDGPQGLRNFIAALAEAGAGSGRQDDRTGRASFCHDQASLSSRSCKRGSHLARAVTTEQILMGSHT
jgi:hypothetical protein